MVGDEQKDYWRAMRAIGVFQRNAETMLDAATQTPMAPGPEKLADTESPALECLLVGILSEYGEAAILAALHRAMDCDDEGTDHNRDVVLEAYRGLGPDYWGTENKNRKDG